MLSALAHILGLDDPSGPWYLFWSGICGDLTLLGAAGGVYHKHNCHQPKCPRIGKHVVGGTPWCSKHRA